MTDDYSEPAAFADRLTQSADMARKSVAYFWLIVLIHSVVPPWKSSSALTEPFAIRESRANMTIVQVRSLYMTRWQRAQQGCNGWAFLAKPRKLCKVMAKKLGLGSGKHEPLLHRVCPSQHSVRLHMLMLKVIERHAIRLH